MTSAPDTIHHGRPTPGWRMLTGSGTGASVALGLLVLVTVFVAAILPRVSESLQTDALRETLLDLPVGAATVTADIDYGDYAGFTGSRLGQRLAATRQQLARFLTGQGVPVRPATAWTELSSGTLSLTGAGPGSTIGTSELQLQLDWSDELMRYARLTAGRWPVGDTRQAGTTIFQVALTPASARLFALHVGSRLSVGPGEVLAVTGIITPVDTGSAFWPQLASAATPVLISVNQTS